MPKRCRHVSLVALIPRERHAEAAEALNVIAAALKFRLPGQLVVMAIVGVFCFIGLWFIGLPNPGVLALIAAASEAVPYLGPFIGAVPSVLVALTIGFCTALWAVAIFIAVHIFEGYLVVPSFPPAIILTSIFIDQFVFGLAGVVFASPIAVVVYTAVRLLYLRNTLKEQVELPSAS